MKQVLILKTGHEFYAFLDGKMLLQTEMKVGEKFRATYRLGDKVSILVRKQKTQGPSVIGPEPSILDSSVVRASDQVLYREGTPAEFEQLSDGEWSEFMTGLMSI